VSKVDDFRLLRGTHGKPAGMRDDERQSFCFLRRQKTVENERIGIELFPAIAFENVSAKTLMTRTLSFRGITSK
jgi:hypothetical protein